MGFPRIGRRWHSRDMDSDTNRGNRAGLRQQARLQSFAVAAARHPTRAIRAFHLRA